MCNGMQGKYRLCPFMVRRTTPSLCLKNKFLGYCNWVPGLCLMNDVQEQAAALAQEQGTCQARLEEELQKAASYQGEDLGRDMPPLLCSQYKKTLNKRVTKGSVLRDSPHPKKSGRLA
eukprot:86055-Pelagomonas_calceolata.AAC.4